MLFRSEAWLRKQPSHPGAGEIAARIKALKILFPAPTLIGARILHGFGRTLARWKRSLCKRLPFFPV